VSGKIQILKKRSAHDRTLASSNREQLSLAIE